MDGVHPDVVRGVRVAGRPPNYRRIIEAGGGSAAGDVAVTGDETAVQSEFRELLDAGATDIWAQPVAVGADRAERSASLRRTRALLRELARA